MVFKLLYRPYLVSRVALWDEPIAYLELIREEFFSAKMTNDYSCVKFNGLTHY